MIYFLPNTLKDLLYITDELHQIKMPNLMLSRFHHIYVYIYKKILVQICAETLKKGSKIIILLSTFTIHLHQ